MQRTMTNMLLASAGFACFLALNSFSLWGFTLLPETALGENAQLLWSAPLSLSNVLTFFVFIIGAYRAPVLFNRSPLAAAVVLLGAAVALMALSTAVGNPGVLVVAGTCMGIGTTCCFFCWARAFFADGADMAKVEIVLGSVLSAVPYLAFLTLDASAIVITIAALALLNVAALFAHERLATREGRADVPQRTVAFGSLAAGFWKPLLCIAMIGFATPVISVISHDSTAGMSFAQQSLMVHSENIIAALILGVVWLGMKRDTSPIKAFTVLFPVIATALLLFLVLDPALRIVVPYVSGIVFVVFSMIVMIESVEVSAARNLGLTAVYALFAGLFYCTNRLSDFVMGAAREQLLLQETTVTLAVVALLYGCSIVMFFITRAPKGERGERAGGIGNGEGSERGGAGGMGGAGVAGGHEQDVAGGHEPGGAGGHEPDVAGAPAVSLIDENCRRLAQARRLSERQTEVLTLLAHGYDIPTIAKKLYVSENTVRTHAKKVYAALDVHSKQEIIELANAPEADTARV